MNLIYQWMPGAYSNLSCLKFSKKFDLNVENIIWYDDFKSVWEKIDNENLAVLPFENSYAWPIHENLYSFLRYDYKIIAEIDLEVNHLLLSKAKNLSDIKKVYSHPQALNQCHYFLKNNNIEAISFPDTAWAAEMISRTDDLSAWAIASSLAWEIYNLSVLADSIQDQDWNTTKFFVIAPSDYQFDLNKNKTKTSLLFTTKNIPASLYKCLWAFATNNVNLVKIESLPSFTDPFSYMFFMTFEGNLEQEKVKKPLDELSFFTKNIKILGEY